MIKKIPKFRIVQKYGGRLPNRTVKDAIVVFAATRMVHALAIQEHPTTMLNIHSL